MIIGELFQKAYPELYAQMVRANEELEKKEEAAKVDCTIIELKSFRSSSLVNMEDDMYRVKMDISIRDWYRLQKHLRRK